MYLRIILLISSAFNLGLILRSMPHWCCDGGEYFDYIIVFSFMLVVFSFINLLSYFKENTKNKGE